MARGVQVTFDAADPHKLARWWATLLGYQIEDAHDLVTRLLAAGSVRETEVVSIDGRIQRATSSACTNGGSRSYRLVAGGGAG
jgi:hypothetical protein